MREHDAERIRSLSEELADIARERRLLDGLLPRCGRGRDNDGGVPNYLFSSLMLVDSFRLTTRTAEEAAHFIVGIETDDGAVGTQLLPFEYSSQSVAGVAGKHAATHEVVIQTHDAGHRILALVHSHPGSGIHANHHSSIDERTQELWEHTTKLIGGIWSRDGYLRWYSSNRPFRVKIIGTHLERIDDNVWKLKSPQTPTPDTLEMQAP
jgi:hypothetical protein